MGSDKVLLEIDGEPLWRRQVRILRAAGAEKVAVVCRPGQPAFEAVPIYNEAVPFWRDIYAGAGPMAGLHAALRGAGGAPVAVLAVDMPGVDSAWFRWLWGFCRTGVGAMARHPEAFEPLAAIYPPEALAEIELRLGRGEFSLQRLAMNLAATSRLRTMPAAWGARGRVRSVNTPRALRGGGDGGEGEAAGIRCRRGRVG
jgi:molybdopterin-guanine dinucleotide biosynthesis protein A